MNQFQQPQQQPVAVPYSGTLDVSDKGVVPDGQYMVQLARLETFSGTKYQSTEPQAKLRFVLAIISGPQQGQEIWKIENLPDVGKPIGPKSGLRKFLGLLRGKPLVDGESINPTSLIGTCGQALIVEGKLTTFLPQQSQPTQQAVPQPAYQAPPMQQQVSLPPAAQLASQQPQVAPQPVQSSMQQAQPSATTEEY